MTLNSWNGRYSASAMQYPCYKHLKSFEFQECIRRSQNVGCSVRQLTWTLKRSQCLKEPREVERWFQIREIMRCNKQVQRVSLDWTLGACTYKGHLVEDEGNFSKPVWLLHDVMGLVLVFRCGNGDVVVKENSCSWETQIGEFRGELPWSLESTFRCLVKGKHVFYTEMGWLWQDTASWWI